MGQCKVRIYPRVYCMCGCVVVCVSELCGIKEGNAQCLTWSEWSSDDGCNRGALRTFEVPTRSTGH